MAETIQEITAGNGEGRKTFMRMVFALGLCALVALVLAFLRPLFVSRTADELARQAMNLPSEATVLYALQRQSGRECVVEFRLKEYSGPGSRLNEVWSMNGMGFTSYPAVAVPKSAGKLAGKKRAKPTPVYQLESSKTAVDGTDIRIRLTYEPKKKLYRYERAILR